MEAVSSIEIVVSHKQVTIEIYTENQKVFLILLKCVLGNPVKNLPDICWQGSKASLFKKNITFIA